MSFKGIIFDFNGVLLWDSDIQEKVWNHVAVSLRGTPLTQKEIVTYLHGRCNGSFLEYLAGGTLTEDEIAHLSKQKEQLYRKECLEHRDMLILSPGARELLDYLSNNRIPITIATSSSKSNVRFFTTHLELDRWFDSNTIVYDDGTLPGKPEPDMYLRAAEKLLLHPLECIVFEDAESGVIAASRAGIGRIYGIANTQERRTHLAHLDDVYAVLESFEKFDMSVLSNYS